MRSYLKGAGFRLEDLAARGEFNVGQLSRIQKGKINFGLKYFQKLAKAMGMSLQEFAREIERHLRLLEHPELKSREVRIETTVSREGVMAIRATGLIDRTNVMQFNRDYFHLAARAGVDKILMHPLALDLDEVERYRTAMHAAQMAKGAGYLPKLAMVTEEKLDKFGMEVATDHGLVALPFPNREEADRYLLS